MTPMIDCVFQLLIFFMLMPNLQAGEGYLTTNLPTTSGPTAGQQTEILRIKIELEATGAEGKGVSIILNDTQGLGGNFDALYQALKGLKDQGLPEDHPVLISPWMGTRHKWVVKAFDMAVAAGFKNIHFAVPYD